MIGDHVSKIFCNCLIFILVVIHKRTPMSLHSYNNDNFHKISRLKFCWKELGAIICCSRVSMTGTGFFENVDAYDIKERTMHEKEQLSSEECLQIIFRGLKR